MLGYYATFILLAPLLAGLSAGLFGRALGPKLGLVGVVADVIAFVFALLTLIEVTTNGSQTIYFTHARDAYFQFGFRLDRLTAVMLVHIAAISMLIQIFSTRYMQQEPGYGRYHSYLGLITFVLFGMVSSANLLQLFLFWQLISWFLPLLSYNYAHAPTARGAFRTFIIQRFGDAAFLAGVIVTASLYGTLDLQEIFERAARTQSLLALWPNGFAIQANTVICLLIFVGAMSKSVQFPLHMWLPDALYAPTPVTALLHAGIINAGGFLLARLALLYDTSPMTLHMVFVIGVLTAILGSSLMLVQNDIKQTLGYSTIGQMGFMIMECGLGAYGLAIFHLIAHGLFKGTIFLNCGGVIHAARQEPKLPHKHAPDKTTEFSLLTWITGLAATLILPLVILLGAHGVLRMPLADSHGATIFLFFGWATSAQAILTLYRLQAVASWKVAATMLVTLFVVVTTYLFAEKRFTYFLSPTPGEVERHFKAGALPPWLFDSIVAGFALLIIYGWYLIYVRSHGRRVRLPTWVRRGQVRLYLLLLNRLYLDGLALRLGNFCRLKTRRLSDSQPFHYFVILLALGLAAAAGPSFVDLSLPQAAAIIISALLLPLFPLQWSYVALLIRLPAAGAGALAIGLPLAGLLMLANFTAGVPVASIQALSVLALCGAIFASLKALAQRELRPMIAQGSVAFFAIFWWRFGATGRMPLESIVYIASIALLTAALLSAAHYLSARYGELTLDRMHGLARPMPLFATLLALLVMCAIGVFPLGLFSSYLTLLLRPGITSSWAVFVIVLTWFFASWYLFRMMQRLLFGPHREDVAYVDLQPRQALAFGAVLLLLIVLSCAPRYLSASNLTADGLRAALEHYRW